MSLRSDVIALFKENGADLVGFGSVERFKGTRVAEIMPETKTVITAAFRVLRGIHRGVEEGSTFYQYGTNGVECMEETIMPLAMLKVCSLIEKQGHLALPQKNQLFITADAHETNPEVAVEEVYRGIAREQSLDFVDAAVRCGLGERGFHGALLTDEFGPLQRLCVILTDAELEETPEFEPHLCDGCRACVKGCTGCAIDETGQVDSWTCAVYYKGANITKNPFMPPDALMDEPHRLEILSGTYRPSEEEARRILQKLIHYPGYRDGYAPAICARACDMACYMHLEEKGVLTRKFKTPYRKRAEWKLGIEPARCAESAK